MIPAGLKEEQCTVGVFLFTLIKCIVLLCSYSDVSLNHKMSKDHGVGVFTQHVLNTSTDLMILKCVGMTAATTMVHVPLLYLLSTMNYSQPNKYIYCISW